MPQVRKLGISLAVIYSILSIPAIVGAFFGICGPENTLKIITETIGLVYICNRVAYIIIAPMLGLAIY